LNNNPSDTADVLRKAADVIDQRGWCQGSFVPPNSDPLTAPVCAEAAISVAGGVLPFGRGFASAGVDAAIAARAARRVFRHRVQRPISDWNDEPERTAEQVTAELRACANELTEVTR
jgi:hypothetical protein